MIELRAIQDPAKPGTRLMEEDGDMLAAAERGELAPTLRFYEWEVPTLSLGYHQSESVLDLDRLAASSVPWVRRPTGGAAVLHSEELTYAIILPGCADPGAASVVQEYVSRALAEGLRAVGVQADVDSRGEPLSALPNRISCFVRTSRWEVTCRGKKIVGSAQRKLQRGLLQHGSILTGPDHLRIVEFLKMDDDSLRQALKSKLALKATTVTEELGRQVEPCELRSAMAEAFERTFKQIPAGLMQARVES